MIENLVLWEKDLFLLFNSPHSPYLDSVMYLISDKYPWILYSILLLFLLLYKQKGKECLLLVLGLVLLIFVGDQLSSHVLKPLFQRYRPTHHPETMELVQTVLGYRGGSYGFISGHTTNYFSFATFTALLLRDRLYTVMAVLVAATVAYSRIYLGVHFITDVIPGIVIGSLIGWGVYTLYETGRRLFLSSPDSTLMPLYHDQPRRSRLIAWSLLLFYVGLWVLSPLFFSLYQ